MKTTHTQGIWNIEENADHYPFIMGDDNNTIAMLFEGDGSLLYGRTHEETSANARLIAAAPELLDGLLECLNYFEVNRMGNSMIATSLKTLIKKATGQ